MEHDYIRLDDLLARHADVQWYEGVAVVQSVCRQLFAKGTSSTEFPTPFDIAICDDGSVRILGTASTKAVPAAAHLLAGTLSDDVPVRLRLAVTQATAGDPAYGSLRDFSETLAYFERPNPELILQALYQRARVASFRTEAIERPAEVPAAENKPAAADPQPAATKPRRHWAGLAAMLVVVPGAAAWLLLAGPRSGAVAAAFSSLKESFAPASEPAQEPVEKPSAGKEKARRTSVTSGTHRTDPGGVNDSHRAPAHRPAQADFVATRSLLMPFEASFTAPITLTSAAIPQMTQTYVVIASGSQEASPEAIYSKANFDVTPPRQVYPALPAEEPAAVRKQDRTVLELLVGENGLVERVRLRTPPRDIHEFMMVSAAKAWRFDPARLDGRPVRFLHTVAITLD